MAITALTDPASLPSQNQDQKTFDANMARYFRDLPLRAQQENELAAALTTIAAGGAYTIPYGFDTATAAADPGAGKLRLNSANLTLVTAIYVSTTSQLGKAVSSLLASFGLSTSAVKGAIRLAGQNDPSRYVVYNLTGVTANGSYYTLAVTYNSTPSPVYLANEVLVMQFTAAGDKGDKGNTGTNGALQLLASATIASAVAQVDFLNTFTDAYNKYVIEIEGVTQSTTAAWSIGLAFAGAVNATASYFGPVADGTTASGGITQFALPTVTSGSAANMTIELRNARAAGGTALKTLGVRGSYWNGAGHTGLAREGVCVITSTCSGFRLAVAGGTFTSGTIRVYGQLAA